MVTCDDNKNEVQKTSTLPKRLSNTHNIDLLGKKILVCGVRGTGKTFLIRDIFNKLKNQVDKIYIVSPYEKAEHIYERENESHKAKIFLNISELPSINFNNKKTKLIIIDSAFGSGSTYIYEKKFQNMLEDKNTTLIFAIQYSLGISQEIRDKFNIYFLAEDKFITTQQILYNHYANFYNSFSNFKKDFDQCNDYYFFTIISKREVFLYKINNTSNSHHFLLEFCNRY